MTTKKEVEELGNLEITWRDKDPKITITLKALIELYAKDFGYTKSKLVELDFDKIRNFLLNLRYPNGNYRKRKVTINECAQAICSKFGTKKVDVERILECLPGFKDLNRGQSSHDLSEDVGFNRCLSITKHRIQAIVKELEGSGD